MGKNNKKADRMIGFFVDEARIISWQRLWPERQRLWPEQLRPWQEQRPWQERQRL